MPFPWLPGLEAQSLTPGGTLRLAIVTGHGTDVFIEVGVLVDTSVLVGRSVGMFIKAGVLVATTKDDGVGERAS